MRQAMGTDSAYDTKRKLAERGVTVSPQAIYEWLAGGDVKEPNLVAFATLYQVSPAWLRYGVGAERPRSQIAENLADLIDELPDAVRTSAVNFVGYEVGAAAGRLIASEQAGRYMSMVGRIRADMERLRAEDPDPKP
jgi:hypothetical protein